MLSQPLLILKNNYIYNYVKKHTRKTHAYTKNNFKRNNMHKKTTTW